MTDDVLGFWLMKDERVAIKVNVHVDDIFVIRRKNACL